MNKYDFKTIALNWRWLKILIPLWIVFGGIPLLFVEHPSCKIYTTVLAGGLLVAVALTLFSIKCFIFYLKEMDKQKQELDSIKNEIKEIDESENVQR